MNNIWWWLARDERGQDLIEYALLAAFISLAALIAMRSLGVSIGGKFLRVTGELSSNGD